ncbi:MAG: hypothetical protein SOZ62_03365 [Eubacteriales bacterium]|nr:hypothetical protein [Eubacteriales bacterium]
MRKIIYAISLLLIVCIMLSACVETDSNDTLTSTNKTDASQTERDYTYIECRKTSDYNETYLALGESSLLLSVSLPSGWELNENSEGYEILRDETVVGRIYPGYTPEEYENNCMDLQTISIDGDIIVDTYILKTSDSPSGYTRCYCYYYMDGDEEIGMVLETDYAEIDYSANDMLIYSCENVDAVNDSCKGSLDKFPANGKDAVLILGNSFINSSKIGGILSSMIQKAGMSTSVYASSIGYANVQTYVQNTDYMNRIKNGEYGVVFMCGFYNQSAVDSLESIVNACKSSRTMLVIFPAHNEPYQMIENACKLWKNKVYFLDWKGEINNLIMNTDATDLDMCIQDQHKHSTALAGFVGAHMIYRAIYGKIPPYITNQVITTEGAKEKLGSYVDIGGFPNIDESMIYRL